MKWVCFVAIFLAVIANETLDFMYQTQISDSRPDIPNIRVARSKNFLPSLSLYRVMLMVPVRKHSAGRQKFPNKHRPHFTKTSTDTYLVLTVAKMPLRLLKVTQLTVMVSFWWEKSSATFSVTQNVGFKTLYGGRFTLSTQFIKPNYLIPTLPPHPTPTTTTDAAPQFFRNLFPLWLQHLQSEKARSCMTFTWHVQNE